GVVTAVASRESESSHACRQDPSEFAHHIHQGHRSRCAHVKSGATRHSTPTPSCRIFGVTKINSSSLSLTLVVVLNRVPKTGMSPSHGTFVCESRRVVSRMPPNTTVW